MNRKIIALSNAYERLYYLAEENTQRKFVADKYIIPLVPWEIILNNESSVATF